MHGMIVVLIKKIMPLYKALFKQFSIIRKLDTQQEEFFSIEKLLKYIPLSDILFKEKLEPPEAPASIPNSGILVPSTCDILRCSSTARKFIQLDNANSSVRLKTSEN